MTSDISLADVLTAAIALGALVVAILALRASQRSATASERSAITAEGVALMAMEVRWVVTAPDPGDHHGSYLLTNAGRYAAYGLVVTGPVTLSQDDLTDIAGGESVKFHNVAAYGDRDFSMTVSWYPTAELTGAPRVWRYPLA